MTTPDYVQLTECLACGSPDLFTYFDLGMQPLANSFKDTADQEEKKYPLRLCYCRNCFHSQLTDSVNPVLLFRDYIYRSGTAQTQIEYFRWFASFVCETVSERTFHDLETNVLDIGCNDGSQLDIFKEFGFDTYGVDPATNLYPISSINHKVQCGYFNGNEFGTKEFSFVVCQNAFAHNTNQHELLKNIRKVLADDGLLFVTTSQADMVINGEFDTIYHEHLSFFNIRSMNALCERSGLHLYDVLKHPIHGNSYIFVISKSHDRPLYIDMRIKDEAQSGIYDEQTYEMFGDFCNYTVKKYVEFMNNHKGKMPIIGYGAPAKGNTFLNYCGIGPDFIIDDSPAKQGKFTPGLGIPVYDSSYLRQFNDEEQVIFVPLAWNFFEEIVNKIAKIRKRKSDIFVRIMPDFAVGIDMHNQYGLYRDFR